MILPGSWLNAIAGSTIKYPRHRVVVWNPNEVTINQVADGSVARPGYNVSAFVESFSFSENIGFENGDDPQTTKCAFSFKRNAGEGLEMRRGLVEDGVIVRVYEGDLRIRPEDWIPIFTGIFRGRPGDNPGTPQDKTEGITAVAYGREEQFLNLQVTTRKFETDPEAEPPITEIDLGTIAYAIAQDHMLLGQNEILFGAQGFTTKHITNQLVEIPALQAIYECVFKGGMKPKFDSLGRLVIVDANLKKSPARIYTTRDYLIVSKIASPNEIEVNNSVVLRGLDHNMTRVIQEDQLLVDLNVVTGFFDAEYEEDIYYSSDHSQRAQNTHLVTKHKIIWSSPSWTEIDEFHGELSIDTHYLKAARIIIFIIWLVASLAALVFEAAATILASLGPEFVEVVEILRGIADVLNILAIVTMAALLWAMQFVGRGRYQIWGRPFEYVYQQISVQHRLVGLRPNQVREIEFRNDFISTKDDLNERAVQLLIRELVKDQLFNIVIDNDPFLEVDDVIETSNGDRFYILTVQKEVRPGTPVYLNLTCWKIRDGATLAVEGASPVE